ncbi:hypothetical protein XENOCAPTIV_026638 [Xenoophorus captivus]|uniref:Uncharacterized protein n=1 Tax=Xenoophorus captivus TaxID=1517983 RepID=A0ABV0SJ67_9TELE
MQHLAANTKGPKLSQEVQSALSLLVDGFTVASPLQSVVQVNTEIFILLHHLHFFSHDGNSVWPIPVSLKIYDHLLCFIHLQDDNVTPECYTTPSLFSRSSRTCRVGSRN